MHVFLYVSEWIVYLFDKLQGPFKRFATKCDHSGNGEFQMKIRVVGGRPDGCSQLHYVIYGARFYLWENVF